MNRTVARQYGMTLIEVVISIVVISIAVSAVLGVLSSNVGRSADALVVSQAVSIAEAYIEEITLKPFVDPDGASGESARASFDDIFDYDGLVDAGAADQFGDAIMGLESYTVSVAVSQGTALPSVPAGSQARIDVRVRFAPYVDYTLSGYRTAL